MSSLMLIWTIYVFSSLKCLFEWASTHSHVLLYSLYFNRLSIWLSIRVITMCKSMHRPCITPYTFPQRMWINWFSRSRLSLKVQCISLLLPHFFCFQPCPLFLYLYISFISLALPPRSTDTFNLGKTRLLNWVTQLGRLS